MREWQSRQKVESRREVRMHEVGTARHRGPRSDTLFGDKKWR